MSRLDAELVRRGLARSRGQAAELIKAGRVNKDGVVALKPALPVGDSTEITIALDGEDPEFASRAGHKLAGVLEDLTSAEFGRALLGRVPGGTVLDLGASTGGFTDVLLREGAAHVIALDVGHGQLLPRLREDPRVTVIEGANARDLTVEQAGNPDLIVGDLSFISLTLILPALTGAVSSDAIALLLVKPQFEVGKDRLGTGGVVRLPELHTSALEQVITCAEGLGWTLAAVLPSRLPGPAGNREFFVALARGETAASIPQIDRARAILEAVNSAADPGA